MNDLIAWLRVQLDEDEREALKAKAMRYNLPTDAPWERERIIAERMGGNSRAVAAHRLVAIFANPARVLAEVEFHRRILDEIADEATDLDMSVDMDRRVGMRDKHAEPYLGDRLVRLLARLYASRSGWREEWSAGCGECDHIWREMPDHVVTCQRCGLRE